MKPVRGSDPAKTGVASLPCEEAILSPCPAPSVSQHVDLPSLSPGPCLTCWTARQPCHSPPSAPPPVLKDSLGRGGHHDFALLHCHEAAAAAARVRQLREHLPHVGASCPRLLRPRPLYSRRHGALQPANPSTVAAKLPYSQLYHPVSLRNMPCALAMFLSYPIRPLSVSLWTLFVTSTQSLTCSFRPQMEPDQDRQPLSPCSPSSRRRRTLYHQKHFYFFKIY